jgi:hypothetical protein
MVAVKFGTSFNLDEHVGFIKRQVDRSLRDPETRRLAVQIVSGNYDHVKHPKSGRIVPVVHAWGQQFEVADLDCAPRDEMCEIGLLWEFVVKNVRYVFDPEEVDTFATVKETLLMGGGDCDDMAIVFAGLGKAIGFKAAGRIVSTNDAPDEWSHIYPMLGVRTKSNPSEWVPLDATVTGAVPGWQYENIARHADYLL